ncbi:hypothetical protein EDC01DRAFT_676744 [Geopyxis carbonaria]|nr:hypothetical protein EDC01DRAFT_676744 [Geopyxis carbonaria]
MAFVCDCFSFLLFLCCWVDRGGIELPVGWTGDRTVGWKGAEGWKCGDGNTWLMISGNTQDGKPVAGEGYT